ncbi:F1 complex, OSCP/delta subunit of ATPase [Ascodesmis nigricans]|uniref:ATP synthase subunit 5, mitochondrial n=1 Tax=Ascodesmis nigricans TaxID=341454 RepID=A0A4S2N5H6_9PEZI|nr:F1 complex, OSCP/delta subunit of ATPase [Ascodesmis nigricans]
MLSARLLARQASRQTVRTFAAAAAPTKGPVKPPVALFGVDGNYASALYTACVKTSTLEAADKALQQLKATLAKDKKLSTIIGSPTLNAEEKSAIINEVMKAAGQDKAVKNLLQVMADNNRLGLVNGVIDKFSTLMSAHKGEIQATITSAQPLDQKTLTRLQTAISKSQFVGAGQSLKVENKVNPEIIGGLVVEVADRTIDLSISSKMAKMNKLLTDAL